MVLWGVWFLYVDHWFVLHGREDWTDGRKSPTGLLAAVIFWPIAWVCWRFAFPLDDWVLPWHHKSENVDPTAPTTEEIDRAVRELSFNVGDRLSTRDQDIVTGFIEAGDLKAAIEHLVITMVATDRRVTKADAELLIDLAIPLGLKDRAGRDLYLLAKQM